jgi:hypothetical protein
MYGSVVVVLLVFIVFVRWIPFADTSKLELAVIENQDEPFFFVVDIPERTLQGGRLGMPPKPVIPLPVPSDRILDEEVVLTELKIDDSPIAGNGLVAGAGEAAGQVMSNPGKPASVLKIVEPVFPDEAQRAGIRAVLAVTFLVNADGNVTDVSVNEIRKYDKTGAYEVTNRIGYGLVESTLRAAMLWRFRPARHNGKPVSSYVKHEFSFGM